MTGPPRTRCRCWRRRGALCLIAQAEARLVAAAPTRRVVRPSRLAPLGPARLRRLAGDLAALLPGELAGACRAALEPAEATQGDGSGILGRLPGGRRRGAGPRLCGGAARLVATGLVSRLAFGHVRIMQPPAERCKEGSCFPHPLSRNTPRPTRVGEFPCRTPNSVAEANSVAK